MTINEFLQERDQKLQEVIEEALLSFAATDAGRQFFEPLEQMSRDLQMPVAEVFRQVVESFNPHLVIKDSVR